MKIVDNIHQFILYLKLKRKWKHFYEFRNSSDCTWIDEAMRCKNFFFDKTDLAGIEVIG